MPTKREYARAAYGDVDLAEIRSIMFRDWRRGLTPVRQMLIQMQESLMDGVDSIVLPNQTRLSATQYRALSDMTLRELRTVVADSKAVIEDRIGKSTRRTIRAYNKSFAQNGLAPLSPEESRRIMDSVHQAMKKEFPVGSGLRYSDRLERAGHLHLNQTRKTLRRSYPEGTLADEIHSRTAMGLRAKGKVRIPGGSMLNKMNRIMVAEEARSANLIAVEAMKARNIAYAHWRLHPAHPWYGGKEICEVLASNVDVDVIHSLERDGMDPGLIDTEGLYKISKWPDYPHPWCKCYPEPLY